MITGAARHNKAYSTPFCRVLPPGEFNGTIPEPLLVYFESFVTTLQLLSCSETRLQTL